MRRQPGPPTPRVSFRNLAPLLAGLFVFLGLTAPARAAVKLPHLISDHMVLQRDVANPLWGWAAPGEQVTVTVAGQTKTTKTDEGGKWFLKLDKLPAGGPHTLTVKGAQNQLTVKDVLVGEVWLASGQSNMAMTVNGSLDFPKEKEAATNRKIRMFTVARRPAPTPQDDCQGAWVVCTPETVGSFSAAAYFFGRDLYGKLHVPMGLINSSYGGTPIEAWISRDVLEKNPAMKEVVTFWEQRADRYDPERAKAAYERQLANWRKAVETARAEGKRPPNRPRAPVNPRKSPSYPAVLYNGMIAPLVPYGIKGAIWYQGESNAGSEKSGALYAVELPALIKDWRGRWGEGDFPFAWVQLPNYQTGARGWPLVREAMLKTLSLPNTGMAVAIDVGEAHNIHPKNKQEVGRRLALWARAEVYGEKIPWSGPLPAGAKVHGNTVEVTFKHVAGGLEAKGDELRGFTIAGADKKWHPARARIEGDKVLVSSPDVSNPVAVRYDWASNPDGNLYNKAGLPASPFRTDKWTEPEKTKR